MEGERLPSHPRRPTVVVGSVNLWLRGGGASSHKVAGRTGSIVCLSAASGASVAAPRHERAWLDRSEHGIRGASWRYSSSGAVGNSSPLGCPAGYVGRSAPSGKVVISPYPSRSSHNASTPPGNRSGSSTCGTGRGPTSSITGLRWLPSAPRCRAMSRSLLRLRLKPCHPEQHDEDTGQD